MALETCWRRRLPQRIPLRPRNSRATRLLLPDRSRLSRQGTDQALEAILRRGRPKLHDDDSAQATTTLMKFQVAGKVAPEAPSAGGIGIPFAGALVEPSPRSACVRLAAIKAGVLASDAQQAKDSVPNAELGFLSGDSEHGFISYPKCAKFPILLVCRTSSSPFFSFTYRAWNGSIREM